MTRTFFLFLFLFSIILFSLENTTLAQRPERPGANRPGGNRPGANRQGGNRRGGTRQGASRQGGTQQGANQQAQAPVKKATIPDDWMEKINWRSIGPANMGGRITSVAVFEKDPCVWWAASASGGLVKTINNGITFEHQFDDQATVSIGDVQVAQSDQNIVWVGTGEANPRNSVSWGDGVYKSTDGGKTWANVGLKESFQIGRIAIHPSNPDIVYVGALGRLWGENEERGLFKTTDGGTTWKKVLFVDNKTGVIDVQMNQKNPEHLVVATYERMRDGTDANDPIKKYGEGSGIYVTKDGGQTFTRSTQGLPSCKLGRVGLSIYRKDPRYVYAIVESEKIAKVPENSAYLGIRSEDADVGARITAVTEETAADKAGLKQEDIVIMVNGKLIESNASLLAAIRRQSAGDKVKFTITRNREKQDVEVTLGKRPENSRSNPFTGTLGGQAANLQGQQGEKENEYGGIYMSKDGGTVWKRINSLNPRPMYYSQIRVDPSDKNFLYVCGTRLYRSKDGGKKFTGDGGNGGIHVDHHSLWIDPKDGRHLILGNDGGIYVTFDRMEHWDHLNHVALGQFYHVGVDSRLNYNVYGGLQDNGSWGGPANALDERGQVNTHWFRVGGGDGFVCLVDPSDHNLVYYESQNGAMGRINLETGARGSNRPRRVRNGPRYRFNWKTPFILSPHNPSIFYSAGNHVFRSVFKGNKSKQISPDITNTDKGFGSAITQSPVDENVLYVGTTDGAVWVTKDGGAEWTPVFYRPQKKKEEAKDEEKKKEESSDKEKPETKSADAKSDDKKLQPTDEPKKTADESAKYAGTWQGKISTERVPEGRRGFELVLKSEGGKIVGTYTSPRGESTITGGKFDATKSELMLEGKNDQVNFTISAKLTGEKMAGTITINDQQEIDFEASRDKKLTSLNVLVSPRIAIGGALVAQTIDDAVTGTWDGEIDSDEVPDEQRKFSFILTMDKKGNVSGTVDSANGEAEIKEGSYDSKKGRLKLFISTEQFDLEVFGYIKGELMDGELNINAGSMVLDFDAKRTEKPAAKDEAKQEVEEKKTEPKKESDAPDVKPQETEKAAPKKQDEAAAKKDEATAKDDPIAGSWSGVMIIRDNEREISFDLKRDAKGKITGTYDTERGDGEIAGGKYDEKTKKIEMFTENENFSMTFRGDVKKDSMSGDVEAGGGRFTFEFRVKRTSASKAVQQGESAEQPKTVPGKKFEELVPGPRWVSSLEASRFSAGRCYITLDGHRHNDDEPYVFATEDFGVTWRSLRANLPKTVGSTRVVREDVVNQNLLYLGCEFSAWVSIDRGQSWTRLSGLPTVAVHEFAVHPKAEEVVAATHGRSLWIGNVSALRQLTAETLTANAHLFKPKNVVRWRRKPGIGNSGTRRFVGSNASSQAQICYSLGKRASAVEITISDIKGKELRSIEGANDSGLHVVQWDLRASRRANVPAGPYLVTLKVDDAEFKQVLNVQSDPRIPADEVTAEEEVELLDLLDEEMAEESEELGKLGPIWN